MTFSYLDYFFRFQRLFSHIRSEEKGGNSYLTISFPNSWEKKACWLGHARLTSLSPKKILGVVYEEGHSLGSHIQSRSRSISLRFQVQTLFFAKRKEAKKGKFLARSGKWKKVTLSSLLKKHAASAAVGNDLIKGGKRGGENGVSAACEIRGGRGKSVCVLLSTSSFYVGIHLFRKKRKFLWCFFCFVFVGNWKALPVSYEYLSEYHPFIFPPSDDFPEIYYYIFPFACTRKKNLGKRGLERGEKVRNFLITKKVKHALFFPTFTW